MLKKNSQKKNTDRELQKNLQLIEYLMLKPEYMPAKIRN